jgi:hypothetical protein
LKDLNVTKIIFYFAYLNNLFADKYVNDSNR